MSCYYEPLTVDGRFSASFSLGPKQKKKNKQEKRTQDLGGVITVNSRLRKLMRGRLRSDVTSKGKDGLHLFSSFTYLSQSSFSPFGGLWSYTGGVL